MDWDPKNTDTDGYICPPCPVFYPTSEEFKHPLKYISSIRHIGMLAGICKIVPPKGWRPPFAINEKTFRFRTRVQQLNCIEGHSRTEGQFVEKLRLFLYQRGEPMKELPRADGQLVNLHLLYKTVNALGGFDVVCATGKWKQVVRRVGRTKAASEPSEQLCSMYKTHYETALLAYERSRDSSSDTSENKTKVKLEEVQATPSGANGTGETKATPSSKPRTRSGRKRPASTYREDCDTEDENLRVKRTLFSDGEHTSTEENENQSISSSKTVGKRQEDQKRTRQRDLEPEALKPLETRTVRLGAPEIRVGQKFFRFFPDSGAVLAEVKRVFGGKKPRVAVRYVDGSNDDIEMATMEILIANGWDANAAELAFNSEICQVCLRGDCWDRMLLCDGCNSGQHIFCLENPLQEVPCGDWYCKECVRDAMDPHNHKENPKFGFDMGAEISMADYKERADAWKREYFSLSSLVNPDEAINDQDLESEYWRLLSIPMHEQRLEVQYGSDVDTGANGSAFPRLDLYTKSLRTVTKRWKNLTMKAKSEYVRQLSEFFSHGLREGLAAKAGGENDKTDAAQSLEQLLERYAKDDWNLNNMPKLPGSVLQYLDEDIKGIMVPWLYAGMCFSTFCWHVEDHNFYSTSYLHCGAPKTWYGIPCASAEHFERTMKELTPELFGSQPDLHMQLVTMFSPKTLREHGVPVYRATHRPNEFIVTFPSAYHAGFNNGFNCAEAVNFATLDWLPWGAKSLRKYREFRKLPVFCHEALVCTLAETLVDGSSFDFEHTETSLLPAVEQLLQDYREFQRRVDDESSEMRVIKRELMADYEKHGAILAADPEASSTSSTRRNMVARACNKTSKMGRSNSVHGHRGAKMKMSEASMRPTRMVLWAGRSGKHEGLRCVTCKQYCYLQAVVCTRCRPPHGSSGGPTVGCLEHYPTMCKCRNPDNFVYLYRYEASRLEEMVYSLRRRLDGVQDWNTECDAAIRSARGLTTQTTAVKPTVLDLKRLLSRGKSCGGADPKRLDCLEFALSGVEKWDARAERLLLSSLKQEERTSLSHVEFESLLADAEKLLVEPSALGKLRQVVAEWRAVRSDATRLLNTVQGIVNEEVMKKNRPSTSWSDVSSFIDSMGAPNVLLHGNVYFGELCTAIASVSKRLRAKRESNTDGRFLSELAHGQRYLGVLCKVNVLAATIVDRTQGSTVMGTPTQGQVERVLGEVNELQLANPHSIANAEALRRLLAVTEIEAAEVEKALRDCSKSTEELEVLLRRAASLPIPPRNTQELKDRLEKCQLWERRAQQLVALVSGSSACPSYKSMAERPSLEEAERFYAQADAHFVSSSSLLRRQVHSRLQDCRRWHDAVHALFLRPSNSHLPLTQFLQTALDKVQHQSTHTASQALQLHSRLHCVCQQVLSERAQVVTCQRCQRYFHPSCVPTFMPQRPSDVFICGSCRPQQRKRTGHSTRAHDSPPIFCVCRGTEQAPMICCDFCDEWYHAVCVDLSPLELDRIEAFRCPRCSRRQNLYYMDKKLLRRECLGRRPALARVESFLTQMQTQLVAYPPGAHELTAYVHVVKRVESDVNSFVREFAVKEFSPVAFATRDYVELEEAAVVQLMERVTTLEVGLDTAQTQLGAVHWCLRACRLVLGPSDRAPRFAHLVALLQDFKSQESAGFAFPRDEYRLMRLTIAERVNKAAQWLRATKTLEVEEWNLDKARRLQREADEVSAYVELPATELQLIQNIITGHANGEEEEQEVTYEEEPVSLSTEAWKKQRHWLPATCL